jgi:hypothetical protein
MTVTVKVSVGGAYRVRVATTAPGQGEVVTYVEGDGLTVVDQYFGFPADALIVIGPEEPFVAAEAVEEAEPEAHETRKAREAKR